MAQRPNLYFSSQTLDRPNLGASPRVTDSEMKMGFFRLNNIFLYSPAAGVFGSDLIQAAEIL